MGKCFYPQPIFMILEGSKKLNPRPKRQTLLSSQLVPSPQAQLCSRGSTKRFLPSIGNGKAVLGLQDESSRQKKVELPK